MKLISPNFPARISIEGNNSADFNSAIDVAAYMINDLVATLEIQNPRDMLARIVVEGELEVDFSYAFIM